MYGVRPENGFHFLLLFKFFLKTEHWTNNGTLMQKLLIKLQHNKTIQKRAEH